MRLAISSFAGRLAAIRRHRGLTQDELARTIDRSRKTIIAWEHGRVRDIHERDLRALARALRCRKGDLLAPLDAPLPPRPAGWPRVKRRLVAVAAITGRIPKPPPMKSSDFDRMLQLLRKLTAEELSELRARIDRASAS